ncbi:MAG: metal ABC transporter permease [Clostridia bacterium]|nr:metal ABC transporter permease [Clostridia bacterium]
MLQLIAMYFSQPFVWFAMIVLVLVSLCAALLGTSLVLKRFSMIGDGLSHVAFGATSIAAATSLAPMAVTTPVTVVAAVLLLRLNNNSKIKGDSAIAMISSGALALGYLVLNLFPGGSSNISGDACTTLFGSASILGLTKTDVATCIILAFAVIFFFIFFYNKIFAITFDESFASATGTKAEIYNSLLAMTTGVVIVIAMKMVGALLISALIIFPALSSMRVFKSFRSVIISSVCISLFCSVVGGISSMLAGTPVGPTVVAFNIAVFIIFWAIDCFKGARKSSAPEKA